MTFQSFTGKDYLRIEVANGFGLDKKNWDERIDWFKSNEDRLESLVKEAADPAMYMAGVRAWRNVQKGNMNHHPIGLDACSSGLQILSAMMGDRSAATLCNVVDTGSRKDAYTVVYNAMLERIGETGKIERNDVKKAIMTSLYGSEAVPKRVFGEGNLLMVFEETMADLAPAAWELNKAFLDMWDPEALKNSWVMPDNFHVHIKIMGQVTEVAHFNNKPYNINYTVNMPISKGRSLAANSTHSIDGMIVREAVRRCNYDMGHIQYLLSIMQNTGLGKGTKRDKDIMVETLWGHYNDSGYLSARILDYLDTENMGLVDRVKIFDMILTMPKKPFEVFAVHDKFCCLPNYGNDIRRQYNQILSDIAKSDLLSFLVTQIMGRVIHIDKMDKDLWKDILETNYALS